MTASDGPGAVGWRFFLWWMLAFLGFPLGGMLALVVVGLDLLRSGGLMETWFQRSTRRRRSAEDKTAVSAGVSL